MGRARRTERGEEGRKSRKRLERERERTERQRREEKTEATTVGKTRKWQEMGSCEQGTGWLPNSPLNSSRLLSWAPPPPHCHTPSLAPQRRESHVRGSRKTPPAGDAEASKARGLEIRVLDREVLHLSVHGRYPHSSARGLEVE